MGGNLDPNIVALMRAIRQHETGNRPVAGATGELKSRYQFMPNTWRGYAQEILGNPNAPLTLANENKVVYHKILRWKQQGLNPGQIAAAWNAGPAKAISGAWKTNVGYTTGTNGKQIRYDTPKYVRNVYSLYKQFASKMKQNG